MLSVYDYSDYRQFIRDYYFMHKASNPGFSLRYLSQRANINSSAFFKFIMEGKRNLTKSTIIKTCLALRLNDDEAQYFENLVFFCQAKTVKEKNFFFDKLIENQRLKNVRRIHESEYAYFSKWYHCVIRELVTMIDFKDDYARLARALSPSIAPAEARESVTMLLGLGFLTKQDGRYRQTDPVLTTGYGLTAHQIVRFQIDMLGKAIESYDRVRPEERLHSSTTIGISRENFALFNRKIRDFRSHLLELARNDERPEVVYQLNMNLFPVSAVQKNETKNHD